MKLTLATAIVTIPAVNLLSLLGIFGTLGEEGALDIDLVLLTKFLNKSERLSNHHLIILFRYFLD
jgi:hypothetical protein